jgi:putative DNA primase/helicase
MVGIFEDRPTTKVRTSEVADVILSWHQVKTIGETDEICVYSDGVYEKGKEYLIKKEVQDLESDANNTFVAEVLGKIKRKTYIPLRDFDDPRFLNLENGIIDLDSGQFLPHSPEKPFLNRIPVRFDPSRKGRLFRRFLYQVLPDHSTRLRVLDAWASCLDKRPLKKATMFLGGRDSGKSTLLNLMTEVLGDSNVSHVSLQDLESDRYASADLLGKLANIHADIDKTEIKRSSHLKTATGGDRIRAQHKFGHAFPFVPYCKFFYSCNQIPETKDESDAWFVRWQIAEFTEEFVAISQIESLRKPDGSLPPNVHVRDDRILDKLKAPEQLAGILNILLARLKRVRKEGGIPNAPSVEETREAWLHSSNHELSFLDQTINPSVEGRIERQPLYEKYIDHCLHAKITPKSQTMFNREVEKLGGVRDVAKEGGRGSKSIAIWKGIEYKKAGLKRVEPIEPPKAKSCSITSITFGESLTDLALAAFRKFEDGLPEEKGVFAPGEAGSLAGGIQTEKGGET